MSGFVTSRRTCLRRAVAGAAAIAAAVPLFWAERASAANLSTQAAANYVTHPGPNGAKCENCQFFIAGAAGPASAGSCAAVAGSISPDGYCAYFTAKS